MIFNAVLDMLGFGHVGYVQVEMAVMIGGGDGVGVVVVDSLPSPHSKHSKFVHAARTQRPGVAGLPSDHGR